MIYKITNNEGLPVKKEPPVKMEEITIKELIEESGFEDVLRTKSKGFGASISASIFSEDRTYTLTSTYEVFDGKVKLIENDADGKPYTVWEKLIIEEK